MKKLLIVIFIMIQSIIIYGKDFLEKPPIEVRIKLLRQVYRIKQEIPVYVYIVNKGNKTLKINLSKHIFQNFAFRIRNLKNIAVKYSDNFFLYRMKNRYNVSGQRLVTLKPKEHFGRVIDIEKLFRLVEPDHYEITGYFFQNPARSNVDRRVASNSLRFILRPPRRVDHLVKKMNTKRQVYMGQKLTPGETVSFTINSKMRRDWQAYFRYIDVLKLIGIFNNYSNRYGTASFMNKRKVLADFKVFLKDFPAKTIVKFFVKRITINRDKLTLGEDAEVLCNIVYKKNRLIERKDYYFFLYKKFDRWFIYKYYVVNK